MANNSTSKSSIQAAFVIVGIFVVICLALFIFKPDYFPLISKPTATPVQPTSSPSNGYQPEIIPPPIELVNPTQTATIVPTNTPVPTPALIVIPTLVSSSLLPDLIVRGLSDPICVPGYENTVLEFTFFVRNIGRVGTRNFGTFDVGVFFILGQRRYSLDEWAAQFDGVIGTSNMQVSNLNPDDDIKFTVVIGLIGNKDFGVEVVANSGENPIRETDMPNNMVLEYFSAYCY